jgi:hypothetical protein
VIGVTINCVVVKVIKMSKLVMLDDFLLCGVPNPDFGYQTEFGLRVEWCNRLGFVSVEIINDTVEVLIVDVGSHAVRSFCFPKISAGWDKASELVSAALKRFFVV